MEFQKHKQKIEKNVAQGRQRGNKKRQGSVGGEGRRHEGKSRHPAGMLPDNCHTVSRKNSEQNGRKRDRVQKKKKK